MRREWDSRDIFMRYFLSHVIKIIIISMKFQLSSNVVAIVVVGHKTIKSLFQGTRKISDVAYVRLNSVFIGSSVFFSCVKMHENMT